MRCLTLTEGLKKEGAEIPLMPSNSIILLFLSISSNDIGYKFLRRK
jgi:hypothetical protein